MTTGYFKGTGGVVHELALPLAEVYADQLAKGDLKRVNADGSRYAEPPAHGSDLTDGRPPRPAVSAPKADWVGYAVSQGFSVTDAEGLTKAELIEKYGHASAGEED